MPCVCERCLDHARTLGLGEQRHFSQAMRKAFKAAAKLWHPDRFEKQSDRQREAEERFKLI